MAIDLDDLEAKVRATGDLKIYRRLVEEAFKRAPAEVAAAHLEKARGELERLIRIVNAMSISGEPIFRTVFKDMWYLMADAFGNDPEAYLHFLEEVKQDLVFEVEMARAEMERQVLLPPRDFQGVRQWIESLGNSLQWYQRMARRLVGYLFVKRGEPLTLQRLRRMDIVSVEAKLGKEIGAGIALGDEYRRLSIPHELGESPEASGPVSRARRAVTARTFLPQPGMLRPPIHCLNQSKPEETSPGPRTMPRSTQRRWRGSEASKNRSLIQWSEQHF